MFCAAASLDSAPIIQLLPKTWFGIGCKVSMIGVWVEFTLLLCCLFRWSFCSQIDTCQI